jgi:outer membrane receptor for ferrienterochelin and colicins
VLYKTLTRCCVHLFILFPSFIFSQEIKILSLKDKSAVPFAFVRITADKMLFQQITDAEGKVVIGNTYNDSVKHTLTVKSVGFALYTNTLSGSELNSLTVIYVKPDTIQLNEVVVTAQYQPTRMEASVQKIKIIDKEKIQQMGAVNLRDVLTNQLNVRLQQDNVLGCTMNMQGISGENVKILVDGVPIIGRLNGNIDLTQINMNNVERIEIIEGPLSVQYGTNALAGTINIITKKGIKNTQTVGITSYYESIGTYNLTGDATFSRKKYTVQLSGGRNYFDGWSATDPLVDFPRPTIADSTRHKQWKPKEQYFASVGYHYQFKKIGIAYKSDYFNEKVTNRGYPRAPYGETSFDDYYFTNRIDNSINVNGNLSKNWKVVSTTSFNYYKRIKKTVYKDLTNLEEQLSSSNDQDTSRFTLLMSRASFIHAKDSTKLNYEVGYDVNYESVLSKRIEKRIQNMGDYALFATAEYKPFQQLVIKPGIRYAYNTNYVSPFVPSINLKWNIAPKHNVRASYARGFRAPTIKELYFYFVDINHNIIGNEKLKSENSTNYSVSYNYNTPIKNVTYKLDVSLFYNDMFNLITLAQITGTEYSYVNIGRYKTIGAQLSTTINYKKLTIQLGFNYTGTYNKLSESTSLAPFNYSPEALSNISYHFSKQKMTISIFYKYNGKLPGYVLVNETIQQRFMDDYQLMDATISKLFFKDHISLVVGCKNVFNVQNIASNLSSGVHSSNATSVALATGRNYFIKMSLNLKSN